MKRTLKHVLKKKNLREGKAVKSPLDFSEGRWRPERKCGFGAATTQDSGGRGLKTVGATNRAPTQISVARLTPREGQARAACRSTRGCIQRSIRILDDDKKRNRNAGSIKTTGAILSEFFTV